MLCHIILVGSIFILYNMEKVRSCYKVILMINLSQDPDNWVLYHLAAMYHRTFTFDLGPAMQCTRRALAKVDLENRPVPLLTLANLLHQGRSIPDATVVVLELLATDPNMVRILLFELFCCKIQYCCLVTGFKTLSLLLCEMLYRFLSLFLCLLIELVPCHLHRPRQDLFNK